MWPSVMKNHCSEGSKSSLFTPDAYSWIVLLASSQITYNYPTFSINSLTLFYYRISQKCYINIPESKIAFQNFYLLLLNFNFKLWLSIHFWKKRSLWSFVHVIRSAVRLTSTFTYLLLLSHEYIDTCISF